MSAVSRWLFPRDGAAWRASVRAPRGRPRPLLAAGMPRRTGPRCPSLRRRQTTAVVRVRPRSLRPRLRRVIYRFGQPPHLASSHGRHRTGRAASGSGPLITTVHADTYSSLCGSVKGRPAYAYLLSKLRCDAPLPIDFLKSVCGAISASGQNLTHVDLSISNI